MSTLRSIPEAARCDGPSSDVILAAQRGDQEAWGRLHDGCHGRIRGLVRRLAGRRLLACEELDDLVGLVFREIVERLPALEYRSLPEFLGWVARLAHSTVAARAQHYTAQKRAPAAPLLALGQEDDGCCESRRPCAAIGPAASALLRDECAALMLCVGQLVPGDRRLVELFLDVGDDMRAIGKAMGIGADAARMRWLRVRRRLRGMVLHREVALAQRRQAVAQRCQAVAVRRQAAAPRRQAA